MIGAAKIQMTAITAIVPDYNVDLNPGQINVLTSNGSSTSPVVYSTVNNGVGPFEYLWVSDSSEVIVNSPTSDNTSLSSSGFDVEKQANITLTVTDVGAGNAETSKTLFAIFIFGF